MEPVGVLLESSWSALNSVTTVEGTDLMAQFLVTHSLSNEQNDEPSLVMKSLFWPVQTIDSYYGSQDINTNMHHWFMDNSVYFSAGSYSNKPTSEYETYSSTMESNMISSTEMRSELAMLNVKEEAIKKSTAIPSDQNNQFDGKISMTADDTGEICTHYIKKSKGKRRIHVCDSLIDVHKVEKPAASPEKKARSPPSQAGYSSKRSKYKKDDSDVNMVDMELDNTAPFMQSSSCNISEDETNFSDEFNGGGCISASPKRSASLNLSGKARAGRGSATDPQSIYARKRRERINERLRILQKLVPNGTKVDISTMLEEAVQYVKFLQVQIKLLSSDKLWMYAPIAYNGTDIGFDLKNIPS